MRLVEVVEVEHLLTLGRTIETEIAEMGVSADDRADAGRGHGRAVAGADVRGAAQESVGGGRHPGDTHADQPGNAPKMRLHDLFDGIGTVVRRSPVTQRGAWDLDPQTLAVGA